MNATFAGKNSQALIQNKKVFEMKQVHGDRILLLDQPEKFDLLYRNEADAVICTIPNLAIAVRTADCVPILISSSQAVAAVHAGWRGTQQQILKKTLLKLKENFGVDLKKVEVAIGPSICEKCYEVGEEVVKEFDEWSELVVIPAKIELGMTSKKFFLNLKLANKLLAEKCGVPASHIQVHPDCTLCHQDKYFSYRGGDIEGRNYSWVSL